MKELSFLFFEDNHKKKDVFLKRAIQQCFCQEEIDQIHPHRILSRIFLKRCLQKVLGIPAHQIVIEKNAFGKPFVKEGPYFSLSHTAFFYVFTWDKDPVGIDVESRFRQVKAWKKLGDKFFTPLEKTQMLTTENFLKIWTRKEAFLKAKGASVKMQDIETTVSPYEFMDGQRWHFQTFFFLDYIVSLCFKKKKEGSFFLLDPLCL